MDLPSAELVSRQKDDTQFKPDTFFGSHQRDIPRTWDKILKELDTLNLRGELPDLSGISALQRDEDSQADITNLPT